MKIQLDKNLTIISREEIEKIESVGLINHKKLRNIILHSEYRKMREKGIPSAECIDALLAENPDLKQDTMRVICCTKINVEIK
ncbi:TPA: hypothetical protein DD449_00025 [Candidatus Berkelbacteria bacterium]|nr:hypothetical protein [Candidatus Berkelbacteria bacterium]